MSKRLAEQIADLKTQMAAQAPAAALEPFEQEQAGLRAAGIPDGVAEAGTTMPDAALLDAHGAATTLAQARAGAPAVVVFYRGAWCPYCNTTLRTYQRDVQPQLADRGIALIAISPQKPDGSMSMQEKNELTFTVLSDPGNGIATALGVLTQPTADARAAQLSHGLDLTTVNADGKVGLPMPTTVLVDADGTIRWIDVHPDYTTRTEPAALTEAVALHLG